MESKFNIRQPCLREFCEAFFTGETKISVQFTNTIQCLRSWDSNIILPKNQSELRKRLKAELCQCFKTCFRYVFYVLVFQSSTDNAKGKNSFYLHEEDKTIRYSDILEALYFSDAAHNIAYSCRKLSMFALYINTMFTLQVCV